MPLSSSAAHPRVAFTLVELLIVLGIVALLIALLLPALSAVRRRGRDVTCAANQRQIAAAMLARAESHGGFLPLAGWVTLADVPAVLPPALLDADASRYAYLATGGVTPPTLVVAPPPVALLPDLGGAAASRAAEVDADAAGLSLFACPAAADLDGTTPTVGHRFGGGGFTQLLPVTCHYAFNAGVMGFDGATETRRLRGRLTRVREAAATALLGDATPVGGDSALLCWTPSPDAATGTTTLADALARTPRMSETAGFDAARHAGRLNAAYADGHVAAAAVTAGDLSGVRLLSE